MNSWRFYLQGFLEKMIDYRLGARNVPGKSGRFVKTVRKLSVTTRIISKEPGRQLEEAPTSKKESTK